MEEYEKRPIRSLIVITVMISLLTGSAFGALAGWYASNIMEKDGQNIVREPGKDKDDKETAKTDISKEESAVIDVVKEVSPAVVSIIITKDLPKIRDFSFSPFFEYFGDEDDLREFFETEPHKSEQMEIGGGTGFIITSNGLILTNRHVISDDDADYTVLLNDGSKYEAEIVGKDPTNDLGFLRINKKGLKTVELGDSDKLEIGQTVIAIGNALGEFKNTVSTGVVSGLRRTITAGGGDGFAEYLSGVIQTDAAINVGNSGGPLLDINGNVIGINTAVAFGSRVQNIGFAIPINDAKANVESILKTGRIVKPFMGVRYVMINQAIKTERELSVNEGALILSGSRKGEEAVVPNSPADKAGLKENDIIISLDDEKVTNDNPLYGVIGKYNVGDTVKVKIIRNGEKKELNIKLGEAPQS